MPAPTHDRYPYAPIAARPVYAWPVTNIVGQTDARVWFTTSGEIAKHAAALPRAWRLKAWTHQRAANVCFWEKSSYRNESTAASAFGHAPFI